MGGGDPMHDPSLSIDFLPVIEVKAGEKMFSLPSNESRAAIEGDAGEKMFSLSSNESHVATGENSRTFNSSVAANMTSSYNADPYLQAVTSRASHSALSQTLMNTSAQRQGPDTNPAAEALCQVNLKPGVPFETTKNDHYAANDATDQISSAPKPDKHQALETLCALNHVDQAAVLAELAEITSKFTDTKTKAFRQYVHKQQEELDQLLKLLVEVEVQNSIRAGRSRHVSVEVGGPRSEADLFQISDLMAPLATTLSLGRNARNDNTSQAVVNGSLPEVQPLPTAPTFSCPDENATEEEQQLAASD
ncbi:MAG: hypothetical protein Q9160_006384 [Pyrenula sp. 1 TL-2023]